jgi:hypothetical protein
MSGLTEGQKERPIDYQAWILLKIIDVKVSSYLDASLLFLILKTSV